MASITEQLLSAADMANTVHAGLQVIEKIAGGVKTADRAFEVVGLIQKVAQALHKGLSGDLHAEDVMKELDQLRTGLAANDAQAQSDLDKKFPSG